MQAINVLHIENAGDLKPTLPPDAVVAKAIWEAYLKLWGAGILHGDVQLRHVRLVYEERNLARVVLIDFGHSRLLGVNLNEPPQRLNDGEREECLKERNHVKKLFGQR